MQFAKFRCVHQISAPLGDVLLYGGGLVSQIVVLG